MESENALPIDETVEDDTFTAPREAVGAVSGMEEAVFASEEAVEESYSTETVPDTEESVEDTSFVTENGENT